MSPDGALTETSPSDPAPAAQAHVSCSIVIRSLNEEKHIGTLLFGLGQQDYPIKEIILVDSGSTDDTVAIARHFGVKVVPIGRAEFSFGRALNLGCQKATGEVLVFVSAHVYPLHRSWLRRLMAPFNDPRYVLSYGRQLGNHLNKFSEHQIFAKWFPEVSAQPQQNHFCNNANCAVRRSAWQRQPYDETLTGLEDLAWAKEAQRHGGLLAYVAEASIVHVHEETFDRVRNRYRREAIAMRAVQPHMRFGFFDFLHLFVQNTVSDCLSARRQRRLREEWQSIVLFRFNQFFGTWQGYRDPGQINADLRRRFYFPHWSEDPRRVVEGVDATDLIDYDDPARLDALPVDRAHLQ